MASSSKPSIPRRFIRYFRRSLPRLVLGVLKALVILTVVAELASYLFGSTSGPDKHAVAMAVLSLLAVSFAYWIVVSSRVQLLIPGLEEGEVVSDDEESSEETHGAWGYAEVIRKMLPWKKRRQGTGGTIQVRRLSSTVSGIAVVNNSPLPIMRARTGLKLVREDDEAQGTDGSAEEIFVGSDFSVPAHGVRPLEVRDSFAHVGIFRLRSTGIRIWDLINLFSCVRGLRGSRRIRVVPNIYRLTRGIPYEREMQQDTLGVPDTPSDALDYSRVREYRPGDPLKIIHWKIVAHSQGELYTKLFETATLSAVTLILDAYGPEVSKYSGETAFRSYDTMLEGGFSLIEHARQSGLVAHMRFVNRNNSLVETSWEGPGTLGWFVETARRPSRDDIAVEKSILSIRSLRDAGAGYVIFATGGLTQRSVRELIACHQRGVSLLVVHALPGVSHSERSRQEAYDSQLRSASINVVALENGSQIIREVSM